MGSGPSSPRARQGRACRPLPAGAAMSPAQRQPRPPGPAPARPLRSFRRRRPPAPDPPFPSIAEPCERRQVAGRRAPSSAESPAGRAGRRCLAPRWGRRCHSPGAASKQASGGGDGVSGRAPPAPRRGERSGAGRGGSARYLAGAVPGRAVLRGRVAPRPAALPGTARMRAPPAPRAPPPHRGTAGPGCGIRAAHPARLRYRPRTESGSARALSAGTDSAGGAPGPGRDPAAVRRQPRCCRSAAGPAGAPQTPRPRHPRRAGQGERSARPRPP